jgi:hypothetical protein
MVISHNPAVLGGLPQDGKEEDYEMVAFMGQVPTRVVGDVAPGLYPVERIPQRNGHSKTPVENEAGGLQKNSGRGMGRLGR